MIEKIGNITLDYSKYPGEDYYCDGAVEDEILEIVQRYHRDDIPRIIEEKKSWPILYHLSSLRENIVDWIPMNKNHKVLEVGSGCGAITGALSRKAGQVTCVDLSKKRSIINGNRHKRQDNISIHVGNFKDIEPDLDRDYDYICLIGVFEYGQGYIGGETPYEEFLSILQSHLSRDGRIIIAIENKYGLKYFAGCKEDHLGTYFSGIENYGEGGVVRTFSKNGLEHIFQNCGVEEYSFYYPYPDYKFMTQIFSDKRLPVKGELTNNIRNFDRERMVLFDEKKAFDGAIQEGLFTHYSNSYLAVIGKEFQTDYVKYSNDRAKEYQIRTEIARNSQDELVVRKYPMSPIAIPHIQQMGASYLQLSERYQGGTLSVNKCRIVEKNQGEQNENGVYAEFEYEMGKPLSELMDQCLEKGDIEGFHQLFHQYADAISYHNTAPITAYDLVFSNILVDGERWTLIDYEWVREEPVDTCELAFRAVYCYLLEDKKREQLHLDYIYQTLSITKEDGERYKDAEAEFQRFVTGERLSMAQIRAEIGYGLLKPEKWLKFYQENELTNRVQIYEDTGNGYSEETSYFLPDAYQGEHIIEFDISVKDQVKNLRIDPAMTPCMVKIKEMTFNGENIPIQKRKMLFTNGKHFGSSIVFATEDPNINIKIDKLQPKEENHLYVLLDIVSLSKEMAHDIGGNK